MAKEIHKKTDTELEKELRDARKRLQQFRFGSSGSKARNVKEGMMLRRTIARLLTERNRRMHVARMNHE